MKLVVPLFLLFPLAALNQDSYIPDTSVNTISLMYGKSFEKKLSEYKLPDYYEADHPPKLELINDDKTQKFTVFHCYGGGKNDICTFTSEYRRKSDSLPFYGVKMTDKNFRTDRGIQLGITLETFKTKIGTTNYKSQTKKGVTKITIDLNDFKNDKFLQAYNMPIYLAEYYFKNGRLIIFEFGFPTP